MHWNKLKPEDVNLIIDRYREGYAINYLATSFSVDNSSIKYWLIKNNVYVKWAIKIIKKPYHLINKPIRKIMPKKKRIVLNPPLAKSLLTDDAKTYAEYIKSSKLFDPDEKKKIIFQFDKLKDREATSSFNNFL